MSRQSLSDNTIGTHAAPPSTSSPSHPPPQQTAPCSPTIRTTTTATSAVSNTSVPPKPEPRLLILGGRIRSFPQAKSVTDPEKRDGAVRRRAATFKDQTAIGEDDDIMDDRSAAPELTNEKRYSTTIELSHIDQDDSHKLKDSKEEISELSNEAEPEKTEAVHTRTWTDRMHGQRPDRHLFPYRSVRENAHAARTFLRRFFFLFLIIPAWVVPNVLQANHDKGGVEISNTTVAHASLEFGGLKYVTLAEAGGGGAAEAGPELSKGAYWSIFVLNLLVMTHLGKAAGAALEELVPKFGVSIVSVFDAMTSSSVELAIAAFALRKRLVFVVQAAMLGAILNNLLLMLGIAILVGGICNHQQKLKKETTQTSINILMITCIAYVIPLGLDTTLTSIHTGMQPVVTDPALLQEQTRLVRAIVDAEILKLSKIMAIILLIVYFSCLLYQYHSRTFMVTPEAKHEGPHTVERRFTHFWFAGLAYVVTMGAQIYSAKLLVHAVENLGKLHQLNDSFVGFVLLPLVLVADLQEEVIAVKESHFNRLDKAVALMVGSCMQIALLVTPILVILGWIMGIPMTFRFSILEVVVLAASVLLVNYLISDHETNWLEGSLLLAMFMMCAIAFYYDNSHELVSNQVTTISGDSASLGAALGVPHK